MGRWTHKRHAVRKQNRRICLHQEGVSVNEWCELQKNQNKNKSKKHNDSNNSRKSSGGQIVFARL